MSDKFSFKNELAKISSASKDLELKLIVGDLHEIEVAFRKIETAIATVRNEHVLPYVGR